ncbi:MAG TPA: MFS transporter [Gammaproteobacteria bacterium]|uniref:Major facilitator superfamily (MFS) profile domain-containing protein n=1 Tax=marine metagenome TaxID=408172 RepID=A0A381PXV3_9ZZZZ|nr:MFS transporter [Gammaproteobacteria bacterium]HCP50583.1 MFS transporter [Gammaproteobacteria bacterium]|tara:strand:+ start:1455 stop:2663 length:1209 start_codon:yes stop_codon:yes gene_type:complete
MFGQTGMRLVSAPTFMPAYLFALSGSEFVVGLTRALQAAGTVISPVIGASTVGHRQRVLSATLITAAMMRIQILGLALSGFFLGQRALLPAIVVFLTFMGFFQGMAQVTMNTLRARVIPVHRRGIVSGTRNFLAGFTSAGVSYLAGAYVLENNLLGNGYGSVFLIAFGIATLGLGALAFTRETETKMVRPRESTRETLRAIPALLRDNPDFARFFIARALGSSGRMALPFYILYAGTQMELTGTVLGLLTTVWMITSSTSNLFWGLLADRRGYRVVMIATLTIWTLSHVQLLFVESLSGVIAFFIVMGIPSGGFNQSGQNMVLEFGDTEDIPIRLAASGSVVNFVGAIGPLLGGLIVWAFSYPALFIVTIALQLVGLLILVRWVPEPRRRHMDTGRTRNRFT